MIARASRYFVASLLVSLVFPVTAGANRPSLRQEIRLQDPDIHDEADPKDTQSCRAMGQLEISYHTEATGAPRVGVIVTDPRNRRIGYDPVSSKTWQELPQAEAFVDCEENGEALRNCQATIQICGPVSGAYKLQVVAAESGKYSLEISGQSAEARSRRGVRTTDSHASVSDISIEKRSRDSLVMRYYREPGTRIELFRGDSRVARNEKPN
jgi:hypothetical protein